jgi:hypothetical protein
VSKNKVILTGKGDTLFYDAQSGRYFMSDIETIKSVLNKLSRSLMTEMFISLNEVYMELGLDTTKTGENMGWHLDYGLIEPHFDTLIAEDGRPCIVLDFEEQPMYWDHD